VLAEASKDIRLVAPILKHLRGRLDEIDFGVRPFEGKLRVSRRKGNAKFIPANRAK